MYQAPHDLAAPPAHHKEIAICRGAGQGSTGFALGRVDGHRHIFRDAISHDPESMADNLSRRLALRGSGEEQDDMGVDRASVPTAAAMPGQPQRPRPDGNQRRVIGPGPGDCPPQRREAGAGVIHAHHNAATRARSLLHARHGNRLPALMR
jgi:hypothetical protein